MRHQRMVGRVGAPVQGDDFYDREPEVDHLLRLLQHGGSHVSLSAQRRTGKTSLLHEVQRRLALAGTTCLYVDLEGARDEAAAIAAIAAMTRPHQGLWVGVQERFRNVLGNVEELGGDLLKVKLRAGLAGDWMERADQLMEVLGASGQVVLMLDELPVLLVRLLRRQDDSAELFLSWLRRVALSDLPIQVVVTGSIGLHPIARRAGLSGTLNHYTPVPLGPWSAGVTLDCLDALASHCDLGWEAEAREEVVARLGSCVPFHVQLLFSLLEEDARRTRRNTVRVEDVQRVYAQHLMTTHGHTELAHMEERLKLAVRPEHHELAIEVLTEAAVAGRLDGPTALRLAADLGHPGAGARIALQDVLGVLEHDGYLEQVEGSWWRFPSLLLRDWWSRRYRLLYIPVAERDPTPGRHR